MKRTTSDPSRSPPRASSRPVATEAGGQPAAEPPPITAGLTDDAVQTLRSKALLDDDFMLLDQLLAERPDLPFCLHMDLDSNAAPFCTLIDALPENSPSPSIDLSGTLPDQVPTEALVELFTHPTLNTLSLTELLLTHEQVAAIVEAVRQTPSALSSLSFSDDAECLLDAGIPALIAGLPQLRTLELGASSLDSSSIQGADPAALALARCLLDTPLDELVLKDFGIFMEHLRASWSTERQPRWKQLTVDLMGLTPYDDLEVRQLAIFLTRCIANPSLDTLSLQRFHIDDGDPAHKGLSRLPCCPAAYRLVELLADALGQRHAPLHIRLESGDIFALEMLMGSLSRRPGIRCVRTLHLAYRPTAASLALVRGGPPPVQRFLDALAACLSALPRLDSLSVMLDPETDPARPAATPLPAAGLTAVARAMAGSHLTSLTLGGHLTPPPEILQPCLQQVGARSVQAELQIRALDLRMGFMKPPMHLPTELGRIIARKIDPDGSGRGLVAQLPALDCTALLEFVDRCNQLAETAGVAEHPLTGLARDIRQRMQPPEEQDQAEGAAGLR